MYVKCKVDLDKKTETYYGQVIERVESKRISAHQVLEIKVTSPFSHLFYVRPLCLIMQLQRPHLIAYSFGNESNCYGVFFISTQSSSFS